MICSQCGSELLSNQTICSVCVCTVDYDQDHLYRQWLAKQEIQPHINSLQPINNNDLWRSFNYKEWQEENSKFNHVEYNAELESIIKNAKSLDDLLQTVGISRPPWRPSAHYDIDGDMLEINLSNRDGYSIWLTPQISIQCDHETHEVTGMCIHWLTDILEKSRKNREKWHGPGNASSANDQ